MRWIGEGLAGPADHDDPYTFTASTLEGELADLLALIREVSPTVIVGYDREGSYGHPDHIRAHHLAAAAAERSGLPLVEVASDESAEGFTWFDLSRHRDQVIEALRCHATLLSVVDGEIVHVGGQHQDLPLRAGLRR
jgi:N-acetyl-1-D-myo-inositol-2-amino-2-deoxy-alpha-D-glucopyranoside deacetylase